MGLVGLMPFWVPYTRLSPDYQVMNKHIVKLSNKTKKHLHLGVP